MTAAARPNEVRRLSIRVALTATALVAATYLAVAVAAVLIVITTVSLAAPHGPAGSFEVKVNVTVPAVSSAALGV